MPPTSLSYKYDLFVSYARADNQLRPPDKIGWVSAFIKELKLVHRSIHGDDPAIFVDELIRSGEDWERVLLSEVRVSALLLVVISPNYFASKRCRWEWEEYTKHEFSRAVGDGGIHPVYYIEVPHYKANDLEPGMKVWVDDLRRRQHAVDMRPWNPEGIAALKQAEARRRLDNLQAEVDRVRWLYGVHLDVPSTVDAHNEHFVGRREEMTQLSHLLSQASFGVVTAIQSLAGMGKTALANEYAHVYADHYAGGRWLVYCEGVRSLGTAFRQLATPLGIEFNDEENKNQDLAVQRILRVLEQLTQRNALDKRLNPACLVILDDVDQTELLSVGEMARVRKQPWVHFLVTTRLGVEEFSGLRKEQVLTLKELPDEDALQMIEDRQQGKQFRSEEDRAAALNIVRKLGGYTLEVEMVAVYLGCYPEITCEAFLERDLNALEDLPAEAHVAERIRYRDKKSLPQVFSPILAALNEEELFVLDSAAFLPADSIPMPWLKAVALQQFPDLAERPGYASPWSKIARKLVGRKLLTATADREESGEERVVRMHRRVKEVIRRRTRTTNEAANAALARLAMADLVRSRADFLWEAWRRKDCRWEVSPVANTACWLLDETGWTGVLVANQISGPLQSLGQLLEAQRLLLRAIEAGEEKKKQRVEPDLYPDLVLATCYSNLATVERGLGNLEEAKRVLRLAMTLEEPILSADDLRRGIRYANLAHAERDPAKARELRLKALDLDRGALPTNDARLALDYRDLGLAEKDLGNLAEAHAYLDTALDIALRCMPEDDLDLASIFSILGLIEHELGNCEKAEALLSRALQIKRSVLADGHPDIANGCVNLSRLLADLGRADQAVALAREAGDIWRKSDVPQDWRLGKVYWVFGAIAGQSGDREKARSHFEEALRLLRFGYNEEHPWIVAVKAQLDAVAGGSP